MPTYLVTPLDPDHRAAARAFATREAAAAVATPNDHLIESAADVIWTGQTLVEVFNALTEAGVKRFESHEVGVRRLLTVLPTVAGDVIEPSTVEPPTGAVEPPEEAPVGSAGAETGDEPSSVRAKRRSVATSRAPNPERYKPGRIRPLTLRPVSPRTARGCCA